MINYSIVQKTQLEAAIRLDAEYYQPEYLHLIENIKKNKYQSLKKFGCKVVSGPFGSSLKNAAYLDSGVPFIRISDLESFFIKEDDFVYISDHDNNRLKQSQLIPYDLVLSKVGNSIGIVSAIPEEFKVCNISENNIGIKFDKNVSLSYKLFILTFLNSQVGLLQVLRSISGNAQPKINIKDIENILFPKPGGNLLAEIQILISNAEQKIFELRNYYKKAGKLLLQELGLSDYRQQDDLVFEVNFSDVKNVGRMDAGYFQPKYKKLVDRIKKYEVKKLGEIVFLKKGIEPGGEAYQDEGRLFIRVSSLSKNGIEEDDQKHVAEELYQQLKSVYEPKVGEILLTKDATPGIAYVVKEQIEGIISGGILRLKPKVEIDVEYLALCINSIVGHTQIKQSSGGSVIEHWKPEQVRELLVPVLSLSKQQQIGDLVRKSHEARKKSKELLAEAKRKVEEMIEKGGDDNGSN